MDNSLQDCSELPGGDVSESDIVQDYKKLSKRQSATNLKVQLFWKFGAKICFYNNIVIAWVYSI